jgi:hypothetical protein
MAYSKQNFENGQVLTAEQLELIEDGILGSAPGGEYCADCYAVTGDGLYYVDDNTANRPSGVGCAPLLVQSTETVNGTDIYLTVKTGASTVQCYYSSWAKAWQPWEWVNPPMNSGVEYRTTERFEGNPVYVKNVWCEYLPNNSQKNVEHGISGASRMLSVVGYIQYGNGVPGFTVVGNDGIKVEANATKITITTNWNAAAYRLNAILKYIK